MPQIQVKPAEDSKNLEPYWKKQKVSMFTETQTMDTLCMIEIKTFNTIPMRTGWNSLRIEETSPQTICYMKHIQLPPARTDIVQEILKRSQPVAEKFAQEYALVTYDLAVTKIAKQI